MTIAIISLTSSEEYQKWIDPDLISITEEIETSGLRTIKVEYTFQDYNKAKEYFQIGSKLWIQGDNNLTDCLYVINTQVEESPYNKNNISFEAEEVLVELNYTPLFLQTELSKVNFNVVTDNGQKKCKVDYNSLNYWFGDYFNIGVVQDCISENAQHVNLQGSMTRMSLLRDIEEQTGNVFVTRYEKDILDNTIHRYLDFLNPINVTNNWSLNLSYNFLDTEAYEEWFDENGDPVNPPKAYEDIPFTSSFPAESITSENADAEDNETERESEYISEYNEIYESSPEYNPITDLDPSDCVFRITNIDGFQLNGDGDPVTDVIENNDNDNKEENILQWKCETAGLNTENTKCTISLVQKGDSIGLTVNNNSYAIASDTDVVEPPAYLEELSNNGVLSLLEINNRELVNLPDDSYFEIYDTTNEKTIYRTRINREIGKVHGEVLDFGFNIDNLTYEIDETDTYTAISPILTLGDNNSTNTNKLTSTDLNTIINNWINLQITKGTVIPMIVEKINVKASTLANAKSNLGTYNLSSNYYTRPLKPNDNKDSTNSTDYTWEFYRATAYWKAPYTKQAGEFHISTETNNNTSYQNIYARPDKRLERSKIESPKIGTTSSTDENIYAIYNQVVQYLREHETPTVDIKVDVANLRHGEFNQYDIHDKVYVKLPESQDILTARVVKTSKEAHDIAKNSIELSNYTPLNTLKTITQETQITCNDLSFKYPSSKDFTARLVNLDYSSTDQYRNTQHPANKLLTFTVNKKQTKDSTNTDFIPKVYTKKTDAYGKAKINLTLDPGDYTITVDFTGDEIYTETSTTINVNVSGTLHVAAKLEDKTTTTTSSNKTTTSSKTKKVTVYWTKCGISKDKKKVVAVAKPSASARDARARGLSGNQWYKTVFKNYCPYCKKSGSLRFDGGKKTKCITSQKDGLGYKPSVQHEKEITCIHCDSDYDGVTGLEKSVRHTSRLKVLEKPKKSNKSELGKLIKGKLVQEVKTETVSSKTTSNKSTRYIKAKGISSKVKKQALSIVGSSTGLTALKKIATWMDKHIVYARYRNFTRSPSTVLSRGSCNCCDGTRTFFQLADAAGCTEYFKFTYIHVPGHVYGLVTNKKTKNSTFVDTASDHHAAWGYVCRGYPKKRTGSTYPKLPF